MKLFLGTPKIENLRKKKNIEKLAKALGHEDKTIRVDAKHALIHIQKVDGIDIADRLIRAGGKKEIDDTIIKILKETCIKDPNAIGTSCLTFLSLWASSIRKLGLKPPESHLRYRVLNLLEKDAAIPLFTFSGDPNIGKHVSNLLDRLIKKKGESVISLIEPIAHNLQYM